MATRPAPKRKSAAAPQAKAAAASAPAKPADGQPRFAQPDIDHADPTKFLITHGSDTAAYKILDAQGRAGELDPLPFPAARGGTEPRLALADVLGAAGASVEQHIVASGQIVFHAAGDTGSTRGPESQNLVADKLESDFDNEHPQNLPRFLFHLGDVVYSFGEAKYYYDQFYDAYRNYPAPILAIAGNHDGIVVPGSGVATLEAFLRNFCAETPAVSPDAGGLDRTTQIQPGVYYTFEAPFVRLIALYSNALEDPGIISSQGGQFPQISDVQIDFLRAALARVAKEKFAGAVIIAHHHPSYTAGGRHGWSETVRQQIDAICKETGIWPHAVLSAHAHNYQRFTRIHAAMQIPYLISGNGGHGVSHLTRKGAPALRVPAVIDTSDGDKVTLESYDDQDYGYLRIVVNSTQLRIEYHPASDGAAAKTPDDSVTVDLKTRKIVHYDAPDLEAPPAPLAKPGRPGHAPQATHPTKRRRARQS
jgi:metallophosphoesterase superfamily enzyme